MNGLIYFALSGDHVKIGFTKNRPADRVAELQVGCPKKIRLLGSIVGPRTLEKQLHAQFSNVRLRGEWFLSSPEMLAEVRALIDADQSAVAAFVVRTDTAPTVHVALDRQTMALLEAEQVRLKREFPCSTHRLNHIAQYAIVEHFSRSKDNG